MSRFARFCMLAIFTCIGLHLCPFGLAPASASTSVPLRILNGNILIVSMGVNGRGPYDFVLDTGTNTSLIEPELAASLQLHPVDRIALSTLTGSAPLPRYIVDLVSIGKADIPHVEMLSQALPALHRLDGNIQGILGLNALREFSFRIDNNSKRLDLFIDEPLPHFSKSKRVAVQVAQDRIVVPVFAEAAIGGVWKLELDSGVSQVIVFGEKISGTKRGNTAAIRITTTSPQSSAATLRNENFEVGLARFSNFPVVVFGAKAAPPPPGEDGLLPVSLFRSVFFDRTTSSLFFEAK
jgi:hypothetical protein